MKTANPSRERLFCRSIKTYYRINARFYPNPKILAMELRFLPHIRQFTSVFIINIRCRFTSDAGNSCCPVADSDRKSNITFVFNRKQGDHFEQSLPSRSGIFRIHVWKLSLTGAHNPVS